MFLAKIARRDGKPFAFVEIWEIVAEARGGSRALPLLPRPPTFMPLKAYEVSCLANRATTEGRELMKPG